MTKLVLFLLFVMCWLGITAMGQSAVSSAMPGNKTNEVMLDVLVHDKKGRIIRDLRQEEIEIFEDGIKQPINSFRFFDADIKKGIDPTSTTTAPQFNLVTLIFDQQEAQRFQTARQAAVTFLDTALKSATLVRVFVVGRKLYLMENFTNERSKIYKAIERSLGTSEKALAEISDRNVKDLTTLVEKDADIVNADAETNVTTLLPRLTLNSMQQADKLLRESGVPSPVFPLLSIARNHRQLPGRKLCFYISNGLYLPNTGLNEILRNVVSAANQANLTFYAINTRQMLANTGGVNSRLETATVINATQSPATGTVGARDPFDSFQGRNAGGTAAFDSRSSFTRAEVIARNKELNKRSPLTDLTEYTGGDIIQNINDISVLVKQAVTELGVYYGIAYSPTKQELDGKYRLITVKLTRNGLKPITRNGYFAVPTTSSKPVLTFETPMLSALTNTVVPHDFDYYATTLQFEQRENERHEVVMMEVPVSQFLQAEDKLKQVYPINFAMMAVVKNSKDEIVQKFSDIYQLEIPSAQIQAAKQSSAYLVRHYWLPAGKYTLETVIHDQMKNRLSASRQPFTVGETTTGLKTSSLYLVKSIESVKEDETEQENPLFVNNLKITPDISGTIATQSREDIPFHLNIYSDVRLPAPKLSIALVHDGKVIATTAPALPKADANGTLVFSAGIPAKGLPSGKYQIRTTVQQDKTTLQDTIAFTVLGETPSKIETDDGIKAITSALAAPTDRISELALVATKSAKPIEMSPTTLIAEIEKNGAQSALKLGEFTYSLRKVRRTFDKKGRLRAEEYKDYEAYPVKGQHALVQISANGTQTTIDRIALDRKQATEALIKNEEEKQKLRAENTRQIGYWGAGIDGFVQGKQVYLSINPSHFFQASEFFAPRMVSLDGRDTIVLDYRPRTDISLSGEKEWVQKMEGTIWIDAVEKVLIRIEGKAQPNPNQISLNSQSAPNLIYQQQRVGAGLWAPMLIRLNSIGSESAFRGLTSDIWFEFGNFKRFDTAGSDLKIQTNPEKSN